MSKYTYILSLQILKTVYRISRQHLYEPLSLCIIKLTKCPAYPRRSRDRRFHGIQNRAAAKGALPKICGTMGKFMPADTRLTFLPYKTLDEMKDIFLTVKEDYDGFYVSGIIPYHAIQTLGEMGRDAVIGYSPIDIENTYRILIQKMVSVKNQQLSRVGMDF